MPEIAEVETVRNTLKTQILNKEIIDVNIIYSKMIETDIDDFKNNLIGKKIVDIKRIGKYLIFDLESLYLISHLRMEGKYFLKNHNDEIVKHEHIIISFNDNTELRYHDTRKFGRMALINHDELMNYPGIKKQGLEPSNINLTKEYLFNNIHNKQISIKTILLDQTIISGLGNIYADEVLFDAKINPLKKGCEVTEEELSRIPSSANKIINKAIEMGGTTIKSYTSSLGVTGKFQQELKVHKREGLTCLTCNTIIKRIKVNGRSTYYCESCQK